MLRVASGFERELFVFTDRRDFYEKRAWSVVRRDPRPDHFVLTRTIP